MTVIAVDPGSEQSAYLIWTGEKILDMGILENETLLRHFKPSFLVFSYGLKPSDLILLIEMPESFGMPVGKTIFETVFWIGRFCQTWQGEFKRVFRSQIKMHFCNSMRAKDSNIRQALINRFGSPGTKKNPGILYGVKKDLWSALAIAVYFMEEGVE